MKWTLLILFFVALIGELIGIQMDSLSRWVTKPLLVVILLIYYVVVSRMKHPLMMLALVSALLGDLFMLLPDGAGLSISLVVFTLTSVIFAALFNKHRENAQSSAKMGLAGVLLLIGIGSAYTLIPKADGLNILIGLHTVAATIMAIFATLRVNKLPGYQMVVGGSVLFMLSGILVGYTRFVAPIPMEGVLITALYGLGLFFIVEGYIKGDAVLVDL